MSYKGFWLEWAGHTAAFVWLSIESFGQYLVSRRRIPLGLIDPVLCNRYFLIGFYTALASLTYFIYIPMYIVYELHGVWSGWLDISLGSVEIISVIALWLSFSAPPFYRRWIGASAAAARKASRRILRIRFAVTGAAAPLAGESFGFACGDSWGTLREKSSIPFAASRSPILGLRSWESGLHRAERAAARCRGDDPIPLDPVVEGVIGARRRDIKGRSEPPRR